MGLYDSNESGDWEWASDIEGMLEKIVNLLKEIKEILKAKEEEN